MERAATAAAADRRTRVWGDAVRCGDGGRQGSCGGPAAPKDARRTTGVTARALLLLGLTDLATERRVAASMAVGAGVGTRGCSKPAVGPAADGDGHPTMVLTEVRWLSSDEHVAVWMPWQPRRRPEATRPLRSFTGPGLSAVPLISCATSEAGPEKARTTAEPLGHDDMDAAEAARAEPLGHDANVTAEFAAEEWSNIVVPVPTAAWVAPVGTQVEVQIGG